MVGMKGRKEKYKIKRKEGKYKIKKRKEVISVLCTECSKHNSSVSVEQHLYYREFHQKTSTRRPLFKFTPN